MQRRLFVTALAASPTLSQAIEEPDFVLLRRLGEVELRQYAPCLVAEVSVPGPADDAGSRAFPILAGYIFGNNQGERKLAMTAPVMQLPVPQKLAMTAPVTQTRAEGGFVVQFVLPKGVTGATAPLPTDERIRLRELPARRLAVIRYTGFWSAANYDEHLARLTTALREAGQPWTGEPVFARYDPPIMPWFLRRNEIWLELP